MSLVTTFAGRSRKSWHQSLGRPAQIHRPGRPTEAWDFEHDASLDRGPRVRSLWYRPAPCTLPMRLSELEPRWWISDHWRDETGREGFDPDRYGMGLSFQCPVHPGGTCRIAVAFQNPIDGKPRATRGDLKE